VEQFDQKTALGFQMSNRKFQRQLGQPHRTRLIGTGDTTDIEIKAGTVVPATVLR
jgi:hypothetical protein